jgi:8-oxo-dGTP diphosphatase
MPVSQNIKVAVDAVVFGYTSKEGLSVLLIKRDIEPFKNSWALPGGLVGNDESLEDAVQRELTEETGVILGQAFCMLITTSTQKFIQQLI